MATIKSQLWLPTNEILTVDFDSEYYILPNFRVWELANNKAQDEIKFEVPNARAWKLLEMLQITRNAFGRMDINSCYRTKSYNATLPDASPNSAHLQTWAFDWSAPSQSEAARDIAIDWWRNLCQAFGEIGAIGLYTWGYHCEIGSDVLYGQKQFQVRDYLGK